MRSAKYLVLAAGLMLATTAEAQAIDATPVASGVVEEASMFPVVVPLGPGYNVVNLNGRGGSVESLVDISASSISFESGVAVSGAMSTATSYSGVDITITNLSDGVLSIEEFGSTIIPAGMGFYLQERVGAATGNNIFTGFGQTFSALTFEDLATTVDVGSPFAYADFDFSVVSNDMTLYSLSGTLSLSFDSEGNVVENYGLSDADFMNGFTSVGYDTNIARGYAWGSTDIVIPLNALIGVGESQVVQYRTSVTAFTRADCITATTCLVAYSGFGDPIGRGGGVEFDALGGDASAFRGFDVSSFDTSIITGIIFDPQQVTPFRLLDGGGGGGAVPEPSTWAAMIFGFGLAGAALRRRRALAYI